MIRALFLVKRWDSCHFSFLYQRYSIYQISSPQSRGQTFWAPLEVNHGVELVPPLWVPHYKNANMNKVDWRNLFDVRMRGMATSPMLFGALTWKVDCRDVGRLDADVGSRPNYVTV